MEYLTQYSEITYLLSVILCTFIVLKYFVIKSTGKQRVLITTMIGIILGVIWLEFVKCELPNLILSFFAAIGLYEYLIKWIMKKLKVEYDNLK
jgi:predicted neutral ceramidase superfamily lipid hydrolase